MAPHHDPEPPPGITPGAPSSEERVAKSLGWIFVLSFLAAPLIVFLIIGPHATLLSLLGPSVLLAVVTFAWYLSIQARQRREIQRADYRICLNCRYSLVDLPDAGTCPECGCAFTLDGLRRSWSWTYAKR